jgi:hypothetical protein
MIYQMGQYGIDLMQRIFYVGKRLPSSCGVARHHQYIWNVLSSIGTVVNLSRAGNATESQSVITCLKLLANVLRHRPNDGDIFFVELAGRFLCQFYSALMMTYFFPSVKTVVYLHDVPSVVGDPRLFKEIDRRYFRWIRLLFFPFIDLECRILRRSIVIATNAIARDSVEQLYRVRCSLLPLVYSDYNADKKEKKCFVPGPICVTDAHLLVESLQKSLPDFQIQVGFVTGIDTEVLALERQYRRVVFLGYLSDEGLKNAYKSAKIVVRYRPGSATGNHYASSSPVVYGAAEGCFVLTNDARGSKGFFDCGAGLEFHDLEELENLLTSLSASDEKMAFVIEKSKEYYETNHTVCSAIGRVTDILGEVLKN